MAGERFVTHKYLRIWQALGKVSGMESTEQLTEQLAAVERAKAAPYVDYPRTPAWYPAAAGLWVGAMIIAVTNLESSKLWALAVAALVGAEFAFIRWYSSYRSVWPRLRGAPSEVASTMRTWIILAIGVIIAVFVVAVLTSTWIAAATAAVLTTAWATLYERRYAAAAETARRRLA